MAPTGTGHANLRLDQGRARARGARLRPLRPVHLLHVFHLPQAVAVRLHGDPDHGAVAHARHPAAPGRPALRGADPRLSPVPSRRPRALSPRDRAERLDLPVVLPDGHGDLLRDVLRRRHAARVELGLKAYLASCLFAAVAGIMSYFDTLGTGILFKMDGRAAGVFEDPNVLGSFLILGALYLVYNLLTGRSRSVVLSLAALLIVLCGIFLSFSRGL